MTILNSNRVMLATPGVDMRSNGSLIQLSEEIDGSNARWVQVAVEGEFLGYTLPNGKQGFKFTRQIFDEVVKNIHEHPSFAKGADGIGTQGVIPWDFDHASETPATAGTRPMLGAPSQGWSSDAQVRMGANGKSELWFLTEFQEPARAYVKSGQYKWASVTLAFSAIDKVTGEPKGALVSTVALTNRPFLEGMQQLVAASATNSDAIASGHAAVPAEETHRMEILKVLAGILNVGADQDSITRRIESMVKLNDGLVAMFSVEPTRATATALLQAAADAQEGHAQLSALINALSVKNHGEAVVRVTDLVAASAKLAELEPKMKVLLDAQLASEEVEVKLDVDRAIASNAAFDESMRGMFELSRKADKAAFLTQYPVTAAAPAAALPHGIDPTQLAAIQALTSNIAATPAGTQLAVQPQNTVPGVSVDSQGNITRLSAPTTSTAGAPATGSLNGAVVNLALYPGVTDGQRMIAHLSQTRPGFKDMDWDDQFESAMLAIGALKGATA